MNANYRTYYINCAIFGFIALFNTSVEQTGVTAIKCYQCQTTNAENSCPNTTTNSNCVACFTIVGTCIPLADGGTGAASTATLRGCVNQSSSCSDYLPIALASGQYVPLVVTGATIKCCSTELCNIGWHMRVSKYVIIGGVVLAWLTFQL